MESYISPKTQKGLPSKIHGKGFFAIDFIKKNEVVAIKKGAILSKEEMKKAGAIGGVELQVGDDQFLAPTNEVDWGKSMVFVNYSCEPNIGMKGVDHCVALRDIQPGEELNLDYAMLANNDSSYECSCGSQNCRHEVTGKDWMKKELQEKYKGYFTDYIQSKIDSANRSI